MSSSIMHINLPASVGYFTIGTLVGVVTEPLSISVKLGLLVSGAVLGGLYLIFRSIRIHGMKDFQVKLYEAFCNFILAIIVGGGLIEYLNYKYSIFQHAADGDISFHFVFYLYLFVAFALVAIGQSGITFLLGLGKDFLRQRLQLEKKEDKDKEP